MLRIEKAGQESIYFAFYKRNDKTKVFFYSVLLTHEAYCKIHIAWMCIHCFSHLLYLKNGMLFAIKTGIFILKYYLKIVSDNASCYPVDIR